jgi:hypothetical protein
MHSHIDIAHSWTPNIESGPSKSGGQDVLEAVGNVLGKALTGYRTVIYSMAGWVIPVGYSEDQYLSWSAGGLG